MKFRSLLAFLPLATATLAAEKAVAPATPSPWGDFVEKDFPFFSSVLDARDAGKDFPKDNLTPRGIILNLGHNLWACFDTDLLRIACIWEGEKGKPPVTPDALAPGSYHVAGQKTKDGQEYLPKPIGKVWLANGIYPGWQVGEKPSFVDPREPTPSPEEVGRGPAKGSRLIDLNLKDHWLEIRLEVKGTKVTQRIMPGGGPIIEFEVSPHSDPLVATLGASSAFKSDEIKFDSNQFEAVHLGKSDEQDYALLLDLHEIDGKGVKLLRDINGVLFAHIPPAKKIQTFQVIVAGNGKLLEDKNDREMPSVFWPETLTTTATLSHQTGRLRHRRNPSSPLESVEAQCASRRHRVFE